MGWFRSGWCSPRAGRSRWMRIMQAVPHSVLWLLDTNRWAIENLRRAAAAHGVVPERLVFAPRRPISVDENYAGGAAQRAVAARHQPVGNREPAARCGGAWGGSGAAGVRPAPADLGG